MRPQLALVLALAVLTACGDDDDRTGTTSAVTGGTSGQAGASGSAGGAGSPAGQGGTAGGASGGAGGAGGAGAAGLGGATGESGGACQPIGAPCDSNDHTKPQAKVCCEGLCHKGVCIVPE